MVGACGGCAHPGAQVQGSGLHLGDAPGTWGTQHWPSGDKDKRGVDVPDVLGFL